MMARFIIPFATGIAALADWWLQLSAMSTGTANMKSI